MEKNKRTTISLANTPVRRALAHAGRSTLMALLLAGVAAGFIHKTCFKAPGARLQPATAPALHKP